MAITVARVDELRPGETKKFLFEWDGQEMEGFVLNYGGELHAYLNRCRHVPMSLDWVENQFFTADGRFVQCATHGAYYRPETGECIAGPPCGRSLIRIPVRVEGDAVVADAPPPGRLPDD